MKKWQWVIVVASLAIAVVSVYRSCRPIDEDYWVPRKKYDADSKDWAQKVSAALGVIAGKDNIIVEKDASIALRDFEISKLKVDLAGQAHEGDDLAAENAKLKADAQAVIDANPAIRKLIENYDLRCANYENQIFTLKKVVDEHVKAREDLGVQVVTLKYQRDTFKKMWEQEASLRAVSDSLRLNLESKYKASRFWTALGKWGPPVSFVVGVVVGVAK
jgi:hypothetical protein